MGVAFIVVALPQTNEISIKFYLMSTPYEI